MLRCVVDYEPVNQGDLFPSFLSWTKDFKFKFGYISTFPFIKAEMASFGEITKLNNQKNYVSYFSSTVLDSSKGDCSLLEIKLSLLCIYQN